ncbi:phosphoribosyltransferase family protein [uncultured Roseobacter sp.]|uniref:phosphoribosyltransferase family protein n=1 Tax=uncultured Roseobacter sp. TaxID=114847 RepID=UPI0026046DD2|nr:phosphoribosyltransferase family protein [uncultured Roseobacter sp.]
MKCFVMMPFGGSGEYDKGERESRIIYSKIIEPAVKDALGKGAIVQVESAKNEAGSITSSIIRSISEADLCIVDITGRNANVFLELGVRFALKRRTTILMHQQTSDLPFDITAYRSFKYDALDQDLYRKQLAKFISESIDAKRTTDSLVFDVLEDHSEYHAKTTTSARVMPWEDYFSRLDRMRILLSEAITDGRYRPNAIIGISNGGAMFADLLAMKSVYTGVVGNLWADRTKHDGSSMFEHSFNNGVLEGLTNQMREIPLEPEEVRILLVDDMVASSITYNAAKKFLSSKLPDAHVRFLPFCYADKEKLEKVRGNLLWFHSGFRLDDDAVHSIHLTEFEKFPYEKPVRSA